MKRKISHRQAFSMIEIILALGIVSYALLMLIALLPVGIKSNQTSTEETQATFILTMLESDLRNTHPAANGGKSQLFGLTLPYTLDGNNRTVLSSMLQANAVSSLYSVGVQEDATPIASDNSPRTRFQVSVIYTQVPPANGVTPVHARLIVNWPFCKAATPVQLTSMDCVKGFVETYVTFPQP